MHTEDDNKFNNVCYLYRNEVGMGQCNDPEGPDGSMSKGIGLPSNAYKSITNTAWVRARLCNLQKGCTRLAAASDKVYQLFAHGRWFSPGTLASSTTKTGFLDIAEILPNVALNTKDQSINQSSNDPEKKDK